MEFLQQLFSEENLIKMITTMLPTLIVAIISPYIVIKIALKQFYTQKWWEAKANAYQRIVESLSSMLFVQEQIYAEDFEQTVKFSDEAWKAYTEIYSKAYEEIRKAKSLGAYIISNDAIDAINLLLKELERRDPEGNWLHDIDNRLGAMKRCMEQVRDIASRDLKQGK